MDDKFISYRTIWYIGVYIDEHRFLCLVEIKIKRALLSLFDYILRTSFINFIF